jgi:tetratricopeptide (TPR) repeat protein
MGGAGPIAHEPLRAGNFAEALAAGAFSDCRAFLASAELPQAKRTLLYCRLAERLYYAGEREEAFACACAAFADEEGGERVAEFCAWLFSNCGAHAEAAAAYQRLLAVRPQWAAGHRHISGSFAGAGNLDRALHHAAQASDLEPSSFEFALYAGSLFADCGRSCEARSYLRRALAIEPQDSRVLHQLSALAWSEGRGEEAVALALETLDREPEDPAHARHAAELLMRSGRIEEAAAIIRRSIERHPEDDLAYRLLSETELQHGRLEAALAAVERALERASDKAEYHVHRGHLLYRLGRFEDSALAFGTASLIDPTSACAKRSQMTAYLDAGRLKDALRAAGELIQREPDNPEYAQAVCEVLNRRLQV